MKLLTLVKEAIQLIHTKTNREGLSKIGNKTGEITKKLKHDNIILNLFKQKPLEFQVQRLIEH